MVTKSHLATWAEDHGIEASSFEVRHGRRSLVLTRVTAITAGLLGERDNHDAASWAYGELSHVVLSIGQHGPRLRLGRHRAGNESVLRDRCVTLPDGELSAASTHRALRSM